MNTRKILTGTALAILFTAAGCQSDLERIEGVTSYAGDAQAINRVKQTEDPWARHSHDTHIHSDGQRIGNAVKRYKENEVTTDTGIEAPTTN